ncbi:hypothetical protein [Metabacillus fastidiosus]|nr:hypothetical protein [Metabacillus fastidiosus]MEC2078472.1 hypothetical protein [Metabacillus fastidiosus]
MNRKKGVIFLSLAIVMILFGLWFSTTNVYKFAKGYFAYDTQLENSQEKEITQATKKEIK